MRLPVGNRDRGLRAERSVRGPCWARAMPIPRPGPPCVLSRHARAEHEATAPRGAAVGAALVRRMHDQPPVLRSPRTTRPPWVMPSHHPERNASGWPGVGFGCGGTVASLPAATGRSGRTAVVIDECRKMAVLDGESATRGGCGRACWSRQPRRRGRGSRDFQATGGHGAGDRIPNRGNQKNPGALGSSIAAGAAVRSGALCRKKVPALTPFGVES